MEPCSSGIDDAQMNDDATRRHESRRQSSGALTNGVFYATCKSVSTLLNDDVNQLDDH